MLLVALGMTGSRAGVAVLVLGLAASLVAGGARLRTLATAARRAGRRRGAAGRRPLVARADHRRRARGRPRARRAHARARAPGRGGRPRPGRLGLAARRAAGARPGRRAGRTSTAALVATAVAVAAVLAGLVALAASERGFGGSLSHAADTFTSARAAPAHGGRERLTATDSGGRRALWDEALGAASDKPAGGWGAGAWPVVHAAYRSADVPARDARSSVAQVLAERGIVGAVLLVAAALLLVAAPVLRLRALPPGPGRDLVAAAVGAAVAWTAGLLVASVWEVPAVTLPVLVLVAVAAARPGLPRHAAAVADPDPQTGGWRWGALAAGATLLAVLATSALLPAWSRGREDTAWRLVSKPRATEQDLLDAAGAARLASKLDPPAVGPNLAAAAVAERRGRPSEARGELLEAVDEQPDSTVAWAALARLALRLADRPGGLAAARRAVALDPHDPRFVALARARRGRPGPGRLVADGDRDAAARLRRALVRRAPRPRRRPRRPARGSAPCPRPRPRGRRARRRGSRPNGASVSVARRPLRASVQVPATSPSQRNVAGMRRFFVITAGRCSSGTIRVRSAWASSDGVERREQPRGAVGVLARPGASGRSTSSRPASSRRTTSSSRSPSTTGPRPVAHHACTSAAVAGPNAARWWRRAPRGGVADAPAPRASSASANAPSRERPAVVRRHHHERQPHPDRVAERALVGLGESARRARRAARRTCAAAPPGARGRRRAPRRGRASPGGP